MEFGEKLKKVREDKGMTQQTLANHLYVTRQAVSRWECGARYPDLLTAKKISEFLDVSIDELVSGENTKQSIEKRSVIEMPRAVILQSSLYAAVFLANLLSCVFLAASFIRGDVEISALLAYFIKYFVLSVLFAAGCILSVNRKLTPKNTGIMASSYFFVCFAYQAAVCLLNGQGFDMGFALLRGIIIYGLSIAVLIRFYFSPERISPLPVYLLSLIWIVLEIRNYFIQAPLYLHEFNSDFGFAAETVRFFGGLGTAFLIVCQVYVFYKKRKSVENVKEQ